MSYQAPKLAWWVVARREVMAKLSDKAFWISTIAVIALMGIGFLVSMWFASQQDQMTVGVSDDSGKQVVALASQLSGSDYEIKEIPAEQLAKAVEDGDVALGIARGDDGWQLTVKSIETTTAPVEQAIATYMMDENAKALGVNPQDLTKGSHVTTKLTGEQQSQDAFVAMVTGMIFSILFFMSALTYGMQIAQSVVEEKESRIVEILTAAIPTRHLLIGKVLGNSIMALGQLLLFLTIGVIGAMFTPFGQYLPMLAPNIGWFVLFFLFGFAALACLWAATGAMATRVQDISNTTMPLMMILMFVYFAGFFARGTVATVLSYVPVASSVMMPQRLLSGQATWVDALIALVLCALFMAVAIKVGEGIYRRGILKTSGILKLKEAFAKER